MVASPGEVWIPRGKIARCLLVRTWNLVVVQLRVTGHRGVIGLRDPAGIGVPPLFSIFLQNNPRFGPETWGFNAGFRRE